MTTDTTISERPTAYALARMAGCADPDTLESPGAVWLGNVYDDALELLQDYDDDRDEARDAIHDRADSAVPVYTHERWRVFVDLAAYREDVTEFGGVEDLTHAAGIALYLIAERLIAETVEEEFDRRDDEE